MLLDPQASDMAIGASQKEMCHASVIMEVLLESSIRL